MRDHRGRGLRGGGPTRLRTLFAACTPRNAVMFGPRPGSPLRATSSYGMHWCANVVCGPSDVHRDGGVDPGRRGGRRTSGWRLRVAAVLDPCGHDRELARGPARLARCLGLTGCGTPGAICWTSATHRCGCQLPTNRGLSASNVGPRVGTGRRRRGHPCASAISEGTVAVSAVPGGWTPTAGSRADFKRS